MSRSSGPTIAEAVAAYGWPPRGHQLLGAELELAVVAQRWAPALAPDASRLAFISDVDGGPRAFVARLDRGDVQRLETGGEPVVELAWSPDGAWIACVIAPGGSVRHEIWLIRPDGSDLRLAVGASHGSAFLGGWSLASGRLGVTHAGKLVHGRRAYLVRPESGESELLAAGDLISLSDVSADESAVLLRHGPRGARWFSVEPRGPGDASRPGSAASAHPRRPAQVSDADASSDLGRFSSGGDQVFVCSDLGRERAALQLVSLADGSSRTLAERSDAELESFAISADRRCLVLLWNVHGGTSALSHFNPASETEWPLAGPPGQVHSGLSLSRDGRWLALCSEAPDQPRDVWLIELTKLRTRTGAGSASEHAPARPALVQAQPVPARAPAVALREAATVAGLPDARRAAPGAPRVSCR